MGRFCGVCGRERPNEHFGGRGRRARVCRACRRKPLEEQMGALWTAEILGFLDQSNISAKNLRRLEALEAEAMEDVALLASLVRRVAQACPRKRKRWKRLKHQHRDLFRLAFDAGLLNDEDLERLDDFNDDSIDEDDVFGIWIEPRHYEVEPTLEEIRLASDETVPF